MEIKGISGVYSAYKAQKTGAAKKSASSVSAKKTDKTDRVEFGFETALTAARNGIARDIKADATPQELVDAQKTAENGVDSSTLADIILMG
jgi:hypothetical protein